MLGVCWVLWLMRAEWFTVTDAGAWALGPTWRRDESGWVLPRWSIGWDVIDWASANLIQPDGERAGEAWEFTAEQMRFLLWWYAVDERGRFVYRDGSLRRLKGWGKDPFAAALAWCELLGPCRVGGWVDGQPVAVPVHAPWVQVLGVSQDQTKNTSEAMRPMIGGKDGAKRLGVDLGKEVTYSANGRLEMVTSSPRTLEGNRPSFAILNEVHLWMPGNEGVQLAAVVKRNLAKNSDGSARSLAITNAHEPGQESVGESDHDLAELIAAGRTRRDDFLYDSLEAPPETDLSDADSIRAGIDAARGDSWWVPVDRLVDEVLDPRNPLSQSKRFYLNMIVASNDALFDQHYWNACVSDGRLERRDAITMFFDGSRSNDHTALVACRVSDGLVQVLGHWDPTDFGGEIPRDAVDGAVRKAFDTYTVVGFFADMRFWESYVDTWANQFGSTLKLWAGAKTGRNAHPIAWDMRGRGEEFANACERFVTDVMDGELRHTGDARLSQHVSNARRAVNRYGFSVRKESRDSQRKIDLAVCAIGARMIRRSVVASGMKVDRPQYVAAGW